MYAITQILVTEGEGQARDSISADDALIIVDGQQQGWATVVAWHGSDVPCLAKTLSK
jgi:hypothetical protein